MSKGTRKAATVDEWRSGSVEDRLEYSLVKVREEQLYKKICVVCSQTLLAVLSACIHVS